MRNTLFLFLILAMILLPNAVAESGTGGNNRESVGASPTPATTDFAIDKTSLKVVLKQGESKKETLSIKNTGTAIFDVNTFLIDLSKFKIFPEGHEITTALQPNEEKTIELTFRASENEKPDIYPGEITFKSPSIEKKIAAIIEVDSSQPLFDVDVEVLPEYKTSFPGNEILLEVSLFNVRGFGRVDVEVEYSIKDLKGNVVTAEHETLAVETQAKFTRALTLPSDLKPGTYVALAKVTYADSIGVSSDLFEIKAKAIKLLPIQLKDYKSILFLAALALIAGIFSFSAYQLGYLRKKAPKTEVEKTSQLKTEEKGEKLKRELEALDKARKSGFISEASYEKDKERIEDKLNKIRKNF